MAKLQQAINNLGESGKTRIGYKVDSYKQALDALQKSKYINAQSQGGTTVGKHYSYEQVDSMQFDANGFSVDRKAAIWKMDLTNYGPVPVVNDRGNSMLACVVGQYGTQVERYECPNVLDTQDVNTVNTLPDSFMVGAKIDLTGTAVSYFNKMFHEQGGDSSEDDITPTQMSGLAYNGFLKAELIFPTAKKSVYVDVIGQAKNSNHSMFYLNTCIIGCSGWDALGVAVNCTVDGKSSQIVPKSSMPKNVLQGKSYNFNSRSITGFGAAQYKNWANKRNNGQLKGDPSVQVDKISGERVYVRLFLNSDDRQKVNDLLPKTYSENIYSTYGKMVLNATQASPTTTGGLAQVQLRQGLEKFKNCIYWGNLVKPKKRSKEQLRYRMGGGHSTFTFQGQNGPAKLESAGQNSALISPLFVPNSWDGDLDCSSFALMVWGSSGIFQQTAKIPCPSTASMMGMHANSYDAYLKPQYTLQIIEMSPGVPLLPGDWLVTGADAHVVVVYDGNTSQVIDVSSGKSKNQTSLRKYNIGRGKRIIRVVDKK